MGLAVLLIAAALLAYFLFRSRRPPASATPAWERHAVGQGAPALPWPLDGRDRALVDLVAAAFSRAGMPSRVAETKGATGPQLEVVIAVASPQSEPIAILSRTWDPDLRRIVTLLVFGGTVEGRLEAIVTQSGFERLGSSELPFATFVRK